MYALVFNETLFKFFEKKVYSKFMEANIVQYDPNISLGF